MDEQNYYKVSYVIEDGRHPGKLVNTDREPEVGEEVVLDGAVYVITEVTELMAPLHDFGFLHATCRYLREAS